MNRDFIPAVFSWHLNSHNFRLGRDQSLTNFSRFLVTFLIGNLHCSRDRNVLTLLHGDVDTLLALNLEKLNLQQFSNGMMLPSLGLARTSLWGRPRRSSCCGGHRDRPLGWQSCTPRLLSSENQGRIIRKILQETCLAVLFVGCV